MFETRPRSESRCHDRARSRSYRASRGAPHEQRKCFSRGSSAGAPQGTEHSRWVKKDMFKDQGTRNKDQGSRNKIKEQRWSCALFLVPCALFISPAARRPFSSEGRRCV